MLETDGSNIIQVVYTLEPVMFGNLVSQRRGGVTSFYLFDGMGSTSQLASGTGSVTDSYVYDSFGTILLVTGSTSNAFRFIGRFGYVYDADLIAYHLRTALRLCAWALYEPRPSGYLESISGGIDQSIFVCGEQSQQFLRSRGPSGRAYRPKLAVSSPTVPETGGATTCVAPQLVVESFFLGLWKILWI